MSIIHSDVEIDKKTGEFKITHTWDEYQVMKACYLDRMNPGSENVEGGWGKRMARIPRARFLTDYELKMYSNLRGKDDVEAKKWMDKWLWKNPEFRCYTPGTRKGVTE